MNARKPSTATIITVGVFAAVFVILLYVGGRQRVVMERHAARGNDLARMAEIWHMYEIANAWVLPPMDTAHGSLMFRSDSVVENFRIVKQLWELPSKPTNGVLFGDLDGYHSFELTQFADPARYAYLGYAVRTEKEGLSFLNAYKSLCARGEVPGDEIDVGKGQGTFGTNSVLRLRGDISRIFVARNMWDGAQPTIASDFPVVIELPSYTRDSGAWVVYLDTHTAYLPYPGPFPMTPAFIKALEEFVPSTSNNRASK